jgi:hypothetical protein
VRSFIARRYSWILGLAAAQLAIALFVYGAIAHSDDWALGTVGEWMAGGAIASVALEFVREQRAARKEREAQAMAVWWMASGQDSSLQMTAKDPSFGCFWLQPLEMVSATQKSSCWPIERKCPSPRGLRVCSSTSETPA